MSTNSKPKERRDLYQEVTDKLVAAIEEGAGKWRMPWAQQLQGMPYNATTKHRYRGVNVLILWSEAVAKGYPTHEWASYRQWAERGATVKAGERGTVIVFYKSLAVKGKDENGEDAVDTIPMLRYSHVFNAAQVDAWQSPAIERPALAQRIEQAEEFLAATGAQIRWGMGSAFYSSHHDFIAMPDRDRFKDTPTSTATENVYSTALHELTHWTGHKTRLAREFGKRFGDDAYAAEELVAELGAAFLCSRIGISAEPRQDHAQYLASWLRVLKADKKAIFTAAARASDAVEFLDRLQPGAALPAPEGYEGETIDAPAPISSPVVAAPIAALPVAAFTPAIVADTAPRAPKRTVASGKSYERDVVQIDAHWSVRKVPNFSGTAPTVYWVMKDGRQIDSFLARARAMKAARDFASGKREFVQRAIRRDLPEGVSWAFHDHRTQGEIARARKPRQAATPQIEPLAGTAPLGVKRTAKAGDAGSAADIAGSGERIRKAPRTRAKAKKPPRAKRQPQGRFVPPAASRIAESVEASSSVPAVVGWRARVAKLASMLGLH